MSHEKLCEKAKEAIDEVFGDVDVLRQTTRESLRDIINHIQICLDCLDEDDATEAR